MMKVLVAYLVGGIYGLSGIVYGLVLVKHGEQIYFEDAGPLVVTFLSAITALWISHKEGVVYYSLMSILVAGLGLYVYLVYI